MATVSQNYTLWLSGAERRGENFFCPFSSSNRRKRKEKLSKRKLSGAQKGWTEIEQKSNQAENKRTK